ncbi:diguanylate cyclase [Paucibacter sp. O1-1]|nr:diguanylate cyclase [Paucibacter sp. O1-1]
MLPRASQDAAMRKADELRAENRHGHHVRRQPWPAVSASFGVAQTASAGYDLQRLVASADVALYHAKRSGRNRVASFPGPTCRWVQSPSGTRDRGSSMPT